ncbi:MAG: hypothetical protein U5L96_10690 [Owenweeksia sp.]|nr:hypothetical protein [Owenweeksia sp.]
MDPCLPVYSDITLVVEKTTSVDELNNIFRQEAGSDRYKGILGLSDEELVSTDILMDTRGSIVDGTSTQVVDGDLVKILAGMIMSGVIRSQMVREAKRIAKLVSQPA